MIYVMCHCFNKLGNRFIYRKCCVYKHFYIKFIHEMKVELDFYFVIYDKFTFNKMVLSYVITSGSFSY